MNKLAPILISVLILVSTEADASLLETLQHRYAHYENFTVEFDQISYYHIMNKHINFKGKLYYKRPDLVRMDVYKPQRQVIIMEGTKVVIYLPEEKNIIVQDVPKELAYQNILAFFAGLASIEKVYDVKEKQGHIFLRPKRGKGSIEVSVHQDLIKQIDVVDAVGNKSDIVLRNYKFDCGISKKLFSFDY